MNCCDEYGNCNQGRDCPIRKERVRQAKELLDKDTTTNAQPAPVQEPLGYLEIDDIESQREYPHNCRNVNLWHEGGQGMAAIYTTPPAQPAPALWMEMVTANLVRADERDVCAKLVDHILKEGGGTWGDAIRARGNT